MMRCLNCFKEIDDKDICLYCGNNNLNIKNKPNCLQPGVLLNNERYLIGKALNAGGFGIVYRAYDIKLEMIVAIKEFFPASLATRVVGKKDIILVENNRGISFSQSKESFLLEAKIMEKFKNNPNVVSGRDWFEENNTAYIVMEFIEGINVRDFMQQNDNKLDLESTQWITKQITNALKDIHAKGYIFRDLTPDNIMITTDLDDSGHNIVKLIDFGAAVNINTRVDTAKDDIVLKPGYAPIEQYVSGGVLGAYTDIYALGATIYRMLSGLVPYEVTDRNKEDILEKLIDLDNTIPEYIDRTIMKAMAIDKKIRFQSVEEFESAFIHDQDVLYPEEELRKLKNKKRIFFGLMMSICVALAGVGYFIKSRKDIGIKNIEVTADTITVMMPCDDVDISMIHEIVETFEKENEQIKVEIEYVPVDKYYERLNGKEKLPTVFFNDQSYDNDALAPLDELLDSIDLDDYYFYKEAKNKFKTRIPLGFDAAVCYVNENTGNTDGVLSREELNKSQIAYNLDYLMSIDKQSYSNIVAKDAFLNEETPYYIGNVTEWDSIADKLGGYWTVKPFTKVLQVRLGDYVSISKEASKNQQNAGMLFIYQLLGDLAQNNRYIQGNGLLPINKETGDVYFNVAHKEFSFIKKQKDINIYYLSEIQKNKDNIEKYNKGG